MGSTLAREIRSTLARKIRSRLAEVQFLKPFEPYDNMHVRPRFYFVRRPLWFGNIGQVVECTQFRRAKREVALKITHDRFPWSGKRELTTLKELSKLDPDKNNLVRLNRHFDYYGHNCLEFELLDKSLYDFMKLRDFKPLCLSEIRVITEQVLVALNALKSIGLAHVRINPKKVMLVNQLHSLKVKLTGFGAAGPVATLCHGSANQCIAYRAPEDLLGLPMNEAIDMWALGCTLAFLYLGQHLYPTECDYEIMRAIVQMQGVPDKHMLEEGKESYRFFICDQYSWRLNDPKEYNLRTSQKVYRSEGIFNTFTSLDDMAKTHSEVTNGAENEDTQAFLSLIKQMLQVDPEKRITPSEALGHNFVTMKHFHTNKDPYVTSACLAMEACKLEQPSVGCRPVDRFAKVMYRLNPMRKFPVMSLNLGLYVVQMNLGKGVTGQVNRCKIYYRPKKNVAVKIMHNTFSWTGKRELDTLTELSKLDPDKNNLVRLDRHFKFLGHLCLEFELLDKTLFHFMKLRHFKPLGLSEIRVITQQLLVALNALKSIGLAHVRINPTTVMLVNGFHSFNVKLISFGEAAPFSTLRYGIKKQCFAYRAPEDFLGLPVNEAIDMWALGCTLAFLYLGQHLYPTRCDYEIMRAIVQMQGLPDKHMLKEGKESYRFFDVKKSSWRLVNAKEYNLRTDRWVYWSDGIFNTFTSLDDMAKTRPKAKNEAESKDTQAFLSLIKQMLQVDPEKRITPSEALGHNFVTMKHLHTNKDASVTSACLAKEDCQLEQSVECRPLDTSITVIDRNGSSITKLDDTLSADDRTKENEPLATADIVSAETENTGLPDKLASAETDENSYMSSTNSDKGNTHFVEVKCHKKWLKRIKRFFSRMIKP